MLLGHLSEYQGKVEEHGADRVLVPKMHAVADEINQVLKEIKDGQ